ncbi:fungal-specific transcription factor domain-containing protein [Aspergillus insuetus]
MNTQACDRCHRRKSRCDKTVPTCGQCRKAGVACKYVDHSRDRQKQVERLQRRVAQLENENRRLSHQSMASSTPPVPEKAQADVEGATGNSNELTEEITFLSSRAGGENQFLGSTSGVFLASLVDATVPTTSTGLSRDQRAAPSPLNGVAPSSSAPLQVTQLPDERVARALHAAYFVHDHLSYPFLHRPSVLRTLNKVYEDTSILANNAFAHFSYFMVLAIATASVYKFDRESLPDAEGYHQTATGRLNELLQGGDIHALQAVLLLCQYRMANSVQDTSTSMWHLVGVAARMCLELGLHREQVYQRGTTSNSQSASYAAITCEIRRRCFWIVSITLGRPLAIRLQDTDVVLPRIDSDSLVNRSDEFSDELAALWPAADCSWHRDTGELSLLEPERSSPDPQHQSSFCTREWYEMLYCNAMLMLYRPSPALSAVSSGDSVVLQSIFAAAKRAVNLYSQLHRWKRINYTWITLHAVFMAGLSYVYAVGQHFRSRKRNANSASPSAFLESDPAIIDVVNDCRTCSNVLVAISERWNMTKNCYDVFNRLSDAILSDAVKHHTNPPSWQQHAPYDTVHNPAVQHDASMNWQSNIGSTLAVDSALRDCLDDLQHFQSSAYGDDPVGQLSHDWLGEIEGMGFDLFLYGDTAGSGV